MRPARIFTYRMSVDLVRHTLEIAIFPESEPTRPVFFCAPICKHGQTSFHHTCRYELQALRGTLNLLACSNLFGAKKWANFNNYKSIPNNLSNTNHRRITNELCTIYVICPSVN